MDDNGCTLLDEVPLEGISSTKIQMGIKPHLNQVSLDSPNLVIEVFYENNNFGILNLVFYFCVYSNVSIFF